MLELLLAYADKRKLPYQPGFKRTAVRWGLEFDAEGRFLGVLPLGDPALGRKNPGQSFETSPYMQFTSSGKDKSQFLVDQARVVALLTDEPGEPNVDAKHRHFVGLLKKAVAEVPALATVAQALTDQTVVEAVRAALRENGAEPSDNVTFKLPGGFPVEWEDCLNWWGRFWREARTLRSLKKSNKKERRLGQMRCLATGVLAEPSLTHDIKVMGGALVSFNERSFCSYGLQQSENAAVSERAAAGYCTALNHILREARVRLGGASVAYWFKGEVALQHDLLAFLTEAETDEMRELSALERARELLEAVETGKTPPDLYGNRFYALTLSAAEGRVMVRDWMEGQFEELARNVYRWFQDLALTTYRGPQTARYPGIERLITSLLDSRRPRQRYEDWIRPIGPERVSLWRAGVRGEAIPYGVLGRLVVVHRPFILRAELEDAERSRDARRLAAAASLLHARMMLMKAYHIRKEPKKGDEPMSAYLNEEHPHPAYQCGRLMAVLAGLQHSALGDVGAGVVQRYYAAASSTPALVLGRLIRNAQFHLGKLEHERPGLAVWHVRKIAEITQRLKDSIPRTLDLEEQSLFALGYYQQMAQKKSDTSVEGKEESHE